MRYGSVQNAEIHLFCSENRNFFLKTNDYVDLMYPITENLKYIHIPQNKENYNEIMKLHFDIITMMEKAKQNLAK